MSVLKKVSIDELITLLSQMRKSTAFVDMKIEPDNTLRVRPSEMNKDPEESKNKDLPNNLNQLLG